MLIFCLPPPFINLTWKTYQYDTRLHGSAYLVADYTIQRSDPIHQSHSVYAALMAVVYCFGIPAGSLYALNKKKREIQKLQMISELVDDLNDGGEMWRSMLASDGADAVNCDASRRKHSAVARGLVGEVKEKSDTNAHVREVLLECLRTLQENDPMLMGMSPLYKDYESTYWWFEVPKFVVTLILCGLVTLIPASGVSQVFVSLVVSMGMMILFANCNPYLSKSDDVLAQFCQLSLTFAMAVGILEKAAESFQVRMCIVCFLFLMIRFFFDCYFCVLAYIFWDSWG